MTAPQHRSGTEHRRLAVGIDGSSHSRSALKWACDEAQRRGCLLHILFAEIGGTHNLPSWYEEGKSVITPGQAVLDDAFGLAVTRHPSVIVESELVAWPPALALTVASRTADLLVVGARGKGGFDELLLGSVSDQCIQYSHCPVAVVSEDPDDRRAREVDVRLVVGIDGSFGSSQALRWALEEASVRSASVEAVHAWQYPPIGSFVLGPPQGFEAAGREIVDGALEFRERWAPDVPFSARAVLGAPVPTLLDAADNAELLVLGAKGHGGFVHALLGSVAHQCARHLRGAIVVTRPLMGPDLTGPSGTDIDRSTGIPARESDPSPVSSDG